MISIEEYVDEYHTKIEKNLNTLKELEESANRREPALSQTIRFVSDTFLQFENIVDLLEAELAYHRQPFWKKLFRKRH